MLVIYVPLRQVGRPDYGPLNSVGFTRLCGSTNLNLGPTSLFGPTGLNGFTDLILRPTNLFGPMRLSGSTDLNLGTNKLIWSNGTEWIYRVEFVG